MMSKSLRGLLSCLPSLGLVVVLGACAQKNNASHAEWQKPAPTSQKEVGMIVEASEPVVAKAAEENHLQIREVSSRHGIYEVFGLSLEEAKKAFPGQKVQPNIYFENLIGKSNTRALLQVSETPPECVKSPDTPSAVISVTNQPTMAGNGAFLKAAGSVLSLSAVKSTANPKFPDANLKTMWAIIKPEASGEKPQYIMSNKVDLSLDTLGAYQIALLVKDSRGVCSVRQGMFMVTAFEPYHGKVVAPAISSSEMSNFTQVKILGADQAWKTSTGKGVVIAVLDTGVQYNHPELAANIFVNNKEIADNGIDDDGNGLVDDVNGWNFVFNNKTPYDDMMHGTHVAGLAAAKHFGMAPDATIMPVKIMNAAGGGDLASMKAGVRYAADMGANIINASWGAGDTPEFASLQDDIEYAKSKGVLMVVAAGNGDEQGNGLNNDVVTDYPATLPNTNIVAVAATGEDGVLASYSNYGPTKVHVATMGGTVAKGIWSTYFENKMGESYIAIQGTSMATPVTCGIAALVKSVHPDYTIDQLKNVLITSATPLPALQGKVVSGGLLRAIDALQAAH